MVREVDVAELTRVVSVLFQEACHRLPEDVVKALSRAHEREESPTARDILDRLLENAELAPREQIPLCQDTGLAVVWVELGQDVEHIFATQNTNVLGLR